MLGTASYSNDAGTLDGLDSTVFTLTSSFNAQTASFTAFTSSINSFSASVLTFTSSATTRLGALEAATASLYSATSSFSGRVGALEAATSSLYSYTSSLNNKTASFATTGSNTFIGTQTISGSVLQSGSFTTTGTIIAQTINVQTVTSSIVYSSGSNIFGNLLGDSQRFTGSMLITGSNIIANVGTACFSSQLCVGSSLVLGSNNAYALYLKDSAGNPKPVMATAGNTNLNFYNVCSTGKININNAADSAVLVSIDNTGAACFASTICGGTINSSGQGLFSDSISVASSTGGQSTFWGGVCISNNKCVYFSGNIGVGIVPNSTGIRVAQDLNLRLEGSSASNENNVLTIGGQGAVSVDAPGVGGGRFIIKNSGLVGIGIDSPSTLLHILGTSATLTIADCTSYTTGVGGKLSLHGQYRNVGDITEGGYIKTSKSNATNGDYGFDMVFATSCYTSGVTEKMRIYSGGGVVISASSANQTLTTGDAGITRTNSYFGTGQVRIGGGSDAGANTVLSIAPGIVSVDAPGIAGGRFKLSEAGTLGINCTGVAARTMVVKGATGCYIVAEFIESAGVHSIEIYPNKNSTNHISSDYMSGGAYLPLSLSGRECSTDLVLGTNGRIGIGSGANKGILTVYDSGCTVDRGIPAFDTQAKGIEIYNANSGTTDNVIGLWISTGPHKVGIASGRTNAASTWEVDLRFYTHPTTIGSLDSTCENMRLYGDGSLVTRGGASSPGLYSDINLKENLSKIPSALNKIQCINGYTFDWKDTSPSRSTPDLLNIIHDAGLIAQEVEEIMPDIVRNNDLSCTKMLNYNGITALLVEGMKEQQCIINTLKTCLGII